MRKLMVILIGFEAIRGTIQVKKPTVKGEVISKEVYNSITFEL